VQVLLVGVAGAAGALSRYGIGRAIGPQSIPWTTLGINLAGSFLLGLLLTTAPGRWSEEATVAAGVGFLGAFTTFSTFGYETHTLLRTGRPATAAVYVIASVVGGVIAAALGYAAGRALTP